jgi:hypothetical protein
LVDLYLGWVGIGFNQAAPFMVPSDIVFGTVFDNGTVFVDDYFANSYPSTSPTTGRCLSNGKLYYVVKIIMNIGHGGWTGLCKDTVKGGVNNLFNTSGFEDFGVTTIKFSRDLVTGL